MAYETEPENSNRLGFMIQAGQEAWPAPELNSACLAFQLRFVPFKVSLS